MPFYIKTLKRLWILLLLAPCCLFAGNQTLAGSEMGTPSWAIDESAGLNDLPSSLLWSISGKELADTSWLYGTIHLIGQEDFFVRPAVEHAFEQSEQVAFEIKLNDLVQLMGMQKMMMLPDSVKIYDLIKADQYEAIKAWVEGDLGGKMSTYDNQKPFVLLQLAMTQLLPPDPASYEMHFMQMAIEREMEIFGLETIADQLAAFDAIPPEQQVLYALETLRNLDSMKELYSEMVRVYVAEDLNRLHKMIIEESPEFKDHTDVLLDKRNENWIEEIEKLIRERSTFVAVGAGHLNGAKGVINLLREQGYKVEPVMP